MTTALADFENNTSFRARLSNWGGGCLVAANSSMLGNGLINGAWNSWTQNTKFDLPSIGHNIVSAWQQDPLSPAIGVASMGMLLTDLVLKEQHPLTIGLNALGLGVTIYSAWKANDMHKNGHDLVKPAPTEKVEEKENILDTMKNNIVSLNNRYPFAPIGLFGVGTNMSIFFSTLARHSENKALLAASLFWSTACVLKALSLPETKSKETTANLLSRESTMKTKHTFRENLGPVSGKFLSCANISMMFSGVINTAIHGQPLDWGSIIASPVSTAVGTVAICSSLITATQWGNTAKGVAIANTIGFCSLAGLTYETVLEGHNLFSTGAKLSLLALVGYIAIKSYRKVRQDKQPSQKTTEQKKSSRFAAFNANYPFAFLGAFGFVTNALLLQGAIFANNNPTLIGAAVMWTTGCAIQIFATYRTKTIHDPEEIILAEAQSAKS